jgi:cytochrome c biogenesis protein CcmG/thiol:disulfide interchange protein DsbE
MIGRLARAGTLLAIVALVVTLTLAFRRDPHDIRTGTVGKPAPAFTLSRLDGGAPLSLSQYAGRAVVLNFWASWCIPCKQENPALVRAYERYRTSDVVIIGILYQDSTDSGRAYVRDLGVLWPTVADEDGRVSLSYGVFGIPETYFIGADGVIAGRHIGPIDEQTLITGIEAIRPAATR